MTFGLLLVLAVAVLSVIVLYRIYPTGLAHESNPNWLDLLFESPLVIFAGRLLLLSIALVLAFAAAFTILSVVSWTKHRQWLTKAGPFEVSREAIEQLQGLVQFWQEQALTQTTEVQQLQVQLQQSNEMLELLFQDEEPQPDV